jgi:5-methylcytosine-specific restriction enzyme B
MTEIVLHDATVEMGKLVSAVDSALNGVGEHGEEEPGDKPSEQSDGQPALLNFDEEYADLSLVIPDIEKAIASIREVGLYNPDDLRDAILGLMLGHVMLAGPPGSGKTFLARKLAQAFNVLLLESTANAEWSVYDVIGSERLKAGGVTEARPGVVTNAVLECYATIKKSVEEGDGYQAAWLLIDEINRADIDRAFGALFTAFSGDASGQFTFDVVQPPLTIPIPTRFRIIATLNSYDTRFVNSMSAALRRRFSRVVIKPARNKDNRIPGEEIEIALNKGIETVSKLRDEQTGRTIRDSVMPFIDDLARVFGAFRQATGNKGLPIGTAQIIDACKYLFILAAFGQGIHDERTFWEGLDDALSAKLTNSIESDGTFAALNKEEFLGFLRHEFPRLNKTTDRIEAFLSGSE